MARVKLVPSDRRVEIRTELADNLGSVHELCVALRRVRARLGDERLSGSGRPDQQDPARRSDVEPVEQLGAAQWELDRVPDDLQLGGRREKE